MNASVAVTGGMNRRVSRLIPVSGAFTSTLRPVGPARPGPMKMLASSPYGSWVIGISSM